jgi:hypothetical protein
VVAVALTYAWDPRGAVVCGAAAHGPHVLRLDPPLAHASDARSRAARNATETSQQFAPATNRACIVQ